MAFFSDEKVSRRDMQKQLASSQARGRGETAAS